MPQVYLVSGEGQPEFEGFVSLEHTHLVMADLRRRLPQFQTELQRKYPTVNLHIEYQRVRFRNPIEPGVAAAAAAGAALGIRFGASFMNAAGKQFGKDAGKAISKLIRLWIRGLEKRYWTKTRRPTRRKTRRKLSLSFSEAPS